MSASSERLSLLTNRGRIPIRSFRGTKRLDLNVKVEIELGLGALNLLFLGASLWDGSDAIPCGALLFRGRRLVDEGTSRGVSPMVLEIEMSRGVLGTMRWMLMHPYLTRVDHPI